MTTYMATWRLCGEVELAGYRSFRQLNKRTEKLKPQFVIVTNTLKHVQCHIRDHVG